ncbi:hypothetical protein [Sporocytophaga myxococcoides]|uniref:hypothetical protein n=1 Tax=Sporocytophaga myxococcoides TaxID=153721 RepID=UPI0018CF7BE0|nr:hypothetical protein [Sporocytophaga myxococcoides]
MGILNVNAQKLTLGAKGNFGASRVNSKKLKDAIGIIGSQEGYWNFYSESMFRLTGGIGGFAEYKASYNLFLGAELNFQHTNTKYYINKFFDDFDSLGTGKKQRVTSDLYIRYPSFNIPIYARFQFTEVKKYYAIGGLSLNINFNPKIIDKKTVVTDNYVGWNLENNDLEKSTDKAKADNFKNFGAQVFLGLGRNFGRYGRDVLVDIRYYFPLTKTQINTSDQAFLENSGNGSVFTKTGVEHINVTTGKNINDFRASYFTLNLAISLYKK